MIINFFIAIVLTMLTEHHLNTGWLVHALGVVGSVQILWMLTKACMKGEVST